MVLCRTAGGMTRPQRWQSQFCFFQARWVIMEYETGKLMAVHSKGTGFGTSTGTSGSCKVCGAWFLGFCNFNISRHCPGRDR